MASVWNKGLNISVFGESHGSAVGIVVDNIPPGIEINCKKIESFMSRRISSSEKTGSTKRRETDSFNIISGLFNNKTTGAPMCAVIKNQDHNSFEYSDIDFLARPGHADFTGSVRYNFFNDFRGGGHFSGRLTAPITFAGAVCQQILNTRNIKSFAHINSVGNINDKRFDLSKSVAELEGIYSKPIAVLDDTIIPEIKNKICDVMKKGDSIGGTIECIILGVPSGIGSPIFDGIENYISYLAFGIPGVKGVEFGAGFKTALMTGSENNDEFYVEDGLIKTKTNNHGGILGGISSGMPIVFNLAIKPTPTISQVQKTVNLKTLENTEILIKGRHDACIVIRAVPVVEAIANIAILSQLIYQGCF